MCDHGKYAELSNRGNEANVTHLINFYEPQAFLKSEDYYATVYLIGLLCFSSEVMYTKRTHTLQGTM
jgi:hypothetical protein